MWGFLVLWLLRPVLGYEYNATGARFLAENGDEMVKIIVGYQNERGLDALFGNFGRSIDGAFKRSPAVTMTIRAADWEALESLPDIDFVEEDRLVYAQAESVPWGIQRVQGDQVDVPAPAHPSSCLGVCIIDSGMMVDHPDLPFDRSSPNLSGISIGLGADDPWDSPTSSHGTHVAGTILAQGGNGRGVVGMIGDADGICLHVARVFGDGPGNTLNSYIDRAVEWCVDQGASVINMSLGSNFASLNSQRIIEQVVNDGVLVIAASGNGGDDSVFYPAGYDGVISVASVDVNFARSAFSQYGKVTLAAPGDAILSTSTTPSVELKTDAGDEVAVSLMDHSISPTSPDSITAETVDCGLAMEVCADAAGKICIIARGITTFAEKAWNCEQGGGIAAIVYNNEAGIFSGTLTESNNVMIPVMDTDNANERTLRSSSSLSLLFFKGGYSSMSGTSMAAPHVTGAVAKIWAALPDCTSSQVQEAILETALDLGDEKLGAGLLQTVDAYNYLLNLPPPCGPGESTTTMAVPDVQIMTLEHNDAPRNSKQKLGAQRLRGSTRQLDQNARREPTSRPVAF